MGDIPASAYMGDQIVWPSSGSPTPPPHDYSLDYLTYEALSSGDLYWLDNDCYYSVNDGPWVQMTYSQDPETLVTGDVVRFKKVGLCASLPTFVGDFKVYGNVESMEYGDNFVGQTQFYSASTAGLFKLSPQMQGSRLIDASNLILPVTTLTASCYRSMFAGCTSLTTAPELPATTLAMSCYMDMFAGCTSLVTAPELPATTLVSDCYRSMFSGCTALTHAPELLATTLAGYCYQNMFDGCTSLTTAPSILPATTLAGACYKSMFQNCTSLTTSPVICGANFFDNSPGNCYMDMFNGCTNLSAVTCLTIPPSGSIWDWAPVYTTNFLQGVAATGVFYKSPNATWPPDAWPGAGYTVPDGWTVLDYTP